MVLTRVSESDKETSSVVKTIDSPYTFGGIWRDMAILGSPADTVSYGQCHYYSAPLGESKKPLSIGSIPIAASLFSIGYEEY
jgi:hypothetical protein